MSTHQVETSPAQLDMTISPTGVKVLMAHQYGYCGGVDAADKLTGDVARQAVDNDVPAWGFHDVVHNSRVAAKHLANGIKRFVKNVDDIADPMSAVVISAHGASRRVFSELTADGHEVFDATCSLVDRTHRAVHQARQAGARVLYICEGKPEPGVDKKLHDEVAGIVGHMDFSVDHQGNLVADPIARSFFHIGDELRDEDLDPGGMYHLVWQTTLPAIAANEYSKVLRAQIERNQPEAQFGRIPKNFVCNAVQNRQDSTKELVDDAIAQGIPQLVVITDPESKNGRGYFEYATTLAAGRLTVVAVANAIEASEKLDVTKSVAVTASASTPKESILETVRLFGRDTISPPTEKTFKLADSTQVALKFVNLLQRRAAAGLVA